MDRTEVRIASVMFVPQTPGGTLAKLLRQEMDKLAPTLGWKFKIEEKAGISVKDKVTKSNPWALDMCEDECCDPCQMSEKKVNCRKRNLVYETSCKRYSSHETGGGFVYIGETARNSRERLGDHMDDLEKKE